MTEHVTPAPVETTGRPARVCRFVPAWALVVLVATLVSVAVNAGPGVAALVDYATRADTVTVAAPSAPLASPVAPAAESGAPCDTDARCEALAAREDQRAGRVPAVAFGPAPDGGVAVSCPDGWEVDGSSVLDARCVPSTALLDA